MTPYLEKNALYPAQIIGAPHPNLGMVIVIPAYNEPDLLRSLKALVDCQASTRAVEVIVVVNDSEKDRKELKAINQKTYEKACSWGLKNSTAHLKFHFLYHTNLIAKHAGVGLARKIGLDEGVYRLMQAERPLGILSCFDADASCDPNYLVALESAFRDHPKVQACGIYYEHPLEGTAFPKKVYRAITWYELHLRYYVHAQRFAGFPFAQQTIGSSMAVRCDAYQKQGGMNKRKAGEDFYFLQKFIPLGHFLELKNTRVIPSPRLSDRVPFGTGKAVGTILEENKGLMTYAPASFQDLKAFFKIVPQLFSIKDAALAILLKQLPESIRAFLDLADFDKKLKEIHSNTTNLKAFENRFYRWFNAFLLMKFVHFCRDNFYDNVPVEVGAKWLLEEMEGVAIAETMDAKSLLLAYRKLDREG